MFEKALFRMLVEGVPLENHGGEICRPVKPRKVAGDLVFFVYDRDCQGEKKGVVCPLAWPCFHPDFGNGY